MLYWGYSGLLGDVVRVSVAVLAEILLRSPRKLFIFIIKKIYLQDQSIQKINNLIFEKNFTGQGLYFQADIAGVRIVET